MDTPPFFLIPGNQKGAILARETVEVPITGKIISVNVKVGDKVKEDDVLCILESMKMENPIVAPVGGTIVEIAVKPGQVVKPGETIAVIEY
jgi:biotin carboxyl carrier protein